MVQPILAVAVELVFLGTVVKEANIWVKIIENMLSMLALELVPGNVWRK